MHITANWYDDTELTGQAICGTVDGELVGSIEVFRSKATLNRYLKHEFYATFSDLPNGRIGYLSGIELPASLRNKGIGEAVVAQMLNVCRRTRVQTVVLLSEDRPHSFWEKCGFSDTSDDAPWHLFPMIRSVPAVEVPVYTAEPVIPRSTLHKHNPSGSRHSENQTAFMREWHAFAQPHPLDRRQDIISLKADDGTEGFVVVQLYPWDDGIHFASIMTAPLEACGKGMSSYVLKHICELADRHGLPMDLAVKPFGQGGGLSATQLTAWYRRYGFKEQVGDMVRAPRNLVQLRTA